MIDQLPLKSELLMNFEVKVDSLLQIGNRRIGYTLEGWFEGPRLKGRILPGGGDWLTIRDDGSMTVDVRSVAETDDGAMIYTHYLGRMLLPAEMTKMDRADRSKADPASYYFRITPYYETASEKYAWLNNIVTVGVGRYTDTGVAYSVYEIT